MSPTPGVAHAQRLRRLRLAKDTMDRDWARPLDLDTLAAEAGYSRYHFLRAFRSAYGETPGQYLSRRRVERAEDLLRTADLSVTEICHLVGFTSLGTFHGRFKEFTGLTPGQYRRVHQRPDAGLIPGCFVLMWAGGFPHHRPSPPVERRDGRRPEGEDRALDQDQPPEQDRNFREADSAHPLLP
ncbi:helix-turn-helix transcriptional regulator [Streptomyces sp. NPDC005438]|uniref:helix-turn-helix transcriptional regulator n=1 Tax=Streptomyces sp. NPDC005438 TaxID=3156880 RepID=UPI0033B4FE13